MRPIILMSFIALLLAASHVWAATSTAQMPVSVTVINPHSTKHVDLLQLLKEKKRRLHVFLHTQKHAHVPHTAYVTTLNLEE